MGLPRPRLLAHFLCVYLTLSVSSAQADNVTEARALFLAGGEASEEQRFEDARTYFQRSAALVPKATTYLNLAVAEIRLGLGHAALTTLDAFAQLADPKEHADMIERAATLRKLAEEIAARESSPPAVLATPDTSQPATESPPSHAAPVVIPPAEPQDHAVSSPSRVTPIALLAGGAIALGGTYAAGDWWRRRRNALHDCDTASPPCDNRDTVKTERNAAAVATFAASAAAVGLVATGVWLLLRTQPKAKQAWLPVWGGIQGRF